MLLLPTGMVAPAQRTVPDFTLERPTSTASAVAAGASAGAVCAQGWSDLFARFREGLRCDTLVSLDRVSSLGTIEWDGSTLEIGSGVDHHAGSRDALVRAALPGPAEGWGSIATERIRRRATLGGNLMARRTRYEMSVMPGALGAEPDFETPRGAVTVSPDALWDRSEPPGGLRLRLRCRRQQRGDHSRADGERGTGPGAARLRRVRRIPVRVLHTGHDHAHHSPAQGASGPRLGDDPHLDLLQRVPLHGLSDDHRLRPTGRRTAPRDGRPRRRGGRPMTASRIGTSDRRGDAALKLTGGALYTADIRLPGMLHAKVLRSPHAHARLVSVDATKARALPGVHAILTRDELAGLDPVYGCYIKDQPVVAQDLVRYAGDVVAAVAADGEAVTPHALGLIEVVYEPLPAVPDIAAALTPDAPELFEKGAGEGAMVPVAAAVANAVHDATGARVTALPLSPERVFDALRSRVR